MTKLDSMRGVFVEMQKSLRLVGEGEKFADLVITVNEDKINECTYLIELKYVTKTDASDSKIQSLIKEASEQVAKYKSALSRIPGSTGKGLLHDLCWLELHTLPDAVVRNFPLNLSFD